MVAEKTKLTIRLQNSSRLCIVRRYPTNLQWQMLKKLQANLMEPEDFIVRWHVTHKQLAKICLCSERTSTRWFSKTFNRIEPTVYHKFLLFITNKLWADLLLREED